MSGTEHFEVDYFHSRLAQGAASPFNVENMEREQQILLRDPLVKRLNIELFARAGTGHGAALLLADRCWRRAVLG